MKPLIDGDILRYEVGYAAEYGWQNKEEIPPWEYVEDLLTLRISNICTLVNATEPPTIYLTGEGNFRDEVATTKVYKGNRLDAKKPWHFKNIEAYLKGVYDVVEVDGYEADDAMCIEQYYNIKMGDGNASIICSRDKDLRQCPGWHYSWEVGRIPSFGPTYVEQPGWLRLSEDRKKLTGVGDMFFYAQCLMGDVVDNVPGLKGYGVVGAYEALCEARTSEEAYEATRAIYEKTYGEEWRERLQEQGSLLWMVREVDGEGKPIIWKVPE